MSEQNKGRLTMGLPRASGGKRRWSGDDGGQEVAAKVLCTSPPHALCAEDVLHHPPLTHAHASTPSIECELTSPLDPAIGTDGSTTLPEDEATCTSSSGAPAEAAHHDDDALSESDDESMDERDDFLDDEEDKDSGFIDTNSIDNSSDEEVEPRLEAPASTSPSPTPPTSTLTITTSSTTTTISQSVTATYTSTITTFSSSSIITSTSSVDTPTSYQLSLTRVLPSPAQASLAPVPPPTPPPQPSPHMVASTDPASPFPTASDCLLTVSTGAQGIEERLGSPVVGEGSVTTVTATHTATVVTSAYQGALTSPAYDPHSYPYPGESYPARPPLPGTWGSCNFYDGSGSPHTNKYMEISPSKSGVQGQSIQCDENGKSYLELGSASPYTHTYSSECGNYTTSPSTYPNHQPYSQTYTSPSTYGQSGTYYNSRHAYSPSPYHVYPSPEGYTGFEGEGGCGYGYGAAGYGGVRGAVGQGRPQRCMSPYCDPTRGAARPSCYHQQRLSVLNVSMYKLNRFRQFPEPNLHRSVLICNTLRHIERELEAEGVSVASILAHSHAHASHSHLQAPSPPPAGTPCIEPLPSSPPASPAPTEGPLPPMHTQLVGSPLAAPVALPPSTPPPVTPPPPAVSQYSSAGPSTQYAAPAYLADPHHTPYDTRDAPRPYQPLPATSIHSGATDAAGTTHEEESVEGEASPATPSVRAVQGNNEERTDAINWCSVLSLSSQTDLDSMNNNEYGEWGGEGGGELEYARTDDAPPWKLPSLSADDVLKSFPEASKRLEATEDLDSIINVLVGS